MTEGTESRESDHTGGLLARWRRLADTLPGARFARAQTQRAQQTMLRELKARLERLDDKPARHETQHASAAPSETGTSPAQRLQILMEHSLNQRPESAERTLCLQILAQLVPDEARILAALSDGGRIAACHVDATSRLGTAATRVVSNASRVGSESGVMLTEQVPYYLSHLSALGLVEPAPEDRTLTTQYDLLEGDSAVRKAMQRIERDLQMRPRVSRHTLCLSPLGAHLWEICQIRE